MIRQRAWLLLLLALAQGSLAVEVPNLFSEEVAVASQGQQDRRQAAGEAMATLLVRLSGTTTVLQDEQIRAALSQASNYLGQFSYRRNDADAAAAYQLLMEFQRKPVIDLLTRAGQPLWSSNRPLIFTCVVVDDGSDRRQLTSAGVPAEDDAQDWNELLEQQAHRRGLPLKLPQSDDGLDCETQATVVSADLTLAGDLRLVGASCVAEWSMLFEGRDYQWKFGSDSYEECVALAMDAVAGVMSASYAFASDGGGEAPLLIEVRGIADFAAYTDVILMLEGLAMVSAVNVTRVNGDRVRYSLDIQGEIDKLQHAIRMKRILEEEELPAPEPAVPAVNAPLDTVALPAPEQPRLAYRLLSQR